MVALGKSQIIYQQLHWIQRRRVRVERAIQNAFGKKSMDRVMEGLVPPLEMHDFSLPLEEARSELSTNKFLRQLAYQVEYNEGRLFQAMLLSISSHREQVAQQILHSSQHSGQEAARHYLTTSSVESTLSSIYFAISQVTYWGFPEDKCFFSSVRPLSDILIYHRTCPHTTAWKASGVDTSFMSDVQKCWVDGLLDIFSPNLVHYCTASIPKGDACGKEHFMFQDKYVTFD